jgi:hypothetical protein
MMMIHPAYPFWTTAAPPPPLGGMMHMPPPPPPSGYPMDRTHPAQFYPPPLFVQHARPPHGAPLMPPFLHYPAPPSGAAGAASLGDPRNNNKVPFTVRQSQSSFDSSVDSHGPPPPPPPPLPPPPRVRGAHPPTSGGPTASHHKRHSQDSFSSWGSQVGPPSDDLSTPRRRPQRQSQPHQFWLDGSRPVVVAIPDASRRAAAAPHSDGKKPRARSSSAAVDTSESYWR